MAKRKRLPKSKKDGLYFTNQSVECFSSGCTLLDCVLGGGWPLGRFSNIVGDSSTGKTLLAIEACANFASTYKNGRIVYVEAEAAFDQEYAQTLGLPRGRIEFPNDDESKEPIQTVEHFFTELEKIIDETDSEGLIILDSLDSLSDQAEMGREITEGTFGQSKQKKMGEIFRRTVQRLKRKRIHLSIISQVRDNVGVSWGKKQTRSGGRSLDFYASQILWLYPKEKIEKTRNKIKRMIGIKTRARCEKNKIGTPFRECIYPIYFNYGLEDVEAGLDFLDSIGASTLEGMSITKLIESLPKLEAEEYNELRAALTVKVKEEWSSIEEGFARKRRKYE